MLSVAVVVLGQWLERTAALPSYAVLFLTFTCISLIQGAFDAMRPESGGYVAESLVLYLLQGATLGVVAAGAALVALRFIGPTPLTWIAPGIWVVLSALWQDHEPPQRSAWR